MGRVVLMPKRKAPSTAWKPGQSGNLGGAKREKLMRDALIVSLKRQAEKGLKTRQLQVVAEALVVKAMEGDVPAIKEIFDRVDGKVPQENHNTNEMGDNTLEALLRAIDGRSRDIVAPQANGHDTEEPEGTVH